MSLKYVSIYTGCLYNIFQNMHHTRSSHKNFEYIYWVSLEYIKKIYKVFWKYTGYFKNIFNKYMVCSNQSIYFACLSVCLCPINVKTAETIRPKFSVGPYMPPVMIKISKFLKIQHIFLITSAFVFVLQCLQRKKFTTGIEYGREAPWKPSSIYLDIYL